MIHQVGIDFPMVDEQGLSDPVIVFDENGRLSIAQWYEDHKCWLEIVDGEGQTYGSKGLVWWSEIHFPHGWVYDSDYYSPYPADEGRDKERELVRMSRAIDIDKVMADIKKTINESV